MTAHWRKPIDFTDETLAAGEGAGRELPERVRSRRSAPSRGRAGRRSRRRSTTTSTRPRRSRCCTSGGARASRRCCARARALRARLARRERRGARRGRRARRAARRRRGRARTSPSPTALRDEIAAAGWDVRDERGRLPTLVPAMTREQVYGRRPVREALRGQREVLELWATERAVKAEAWLRETTQPRVQVKLDKDISRGRRHARPPGRARLVRAVQVRGRLRARRDRAAAARVPRPGQRPAQPRRRHAGARRARARPGVVVPSHGSALRDGGGLPRVRGRGRASAGRRRHEPRALPRGDQAERRPLGRRRGRRERRRRCGRPISPAASPSSSARRGRACARSCGGRATSRSSIPQLGQRRVAERQRRRGGAALRGAAAARWLSRRSTSSTASTSCTRAGSARRRSCATCSRAGSPAKGARGVLVFDGHGPDEEHGPLAVRWAADADTLIERLAAEHRRGEQVAVVSSDEAVRGTSGAEVRKLSSRTFLARARARRATSTARAATCATSSTRRRSRALERLRRGE